MLEIILACSLGYVSDNGPTGFMFSDVSTNLKPTNGYQLHNYLSIHEHIESIGTDTIGLGPLGIKVGSNRFRTRHLDYTPMTRLTNGSVVLIDKPEITDKSEYERMYNDMSTWPNYLTVIEFWWTTSPNYTDWAVSDRHSVSTQNLTKLIEEMDLENRYGLRDGGENTPMIPVEDGSHIEYDIHMMLLPTDIELNDDQYIDGLYELKNLRTHMRNLIGLNATNFTGELLDNFFSPPEIITPFFDPSKQAYISDASGHPELKHIDDKAYTVAIPIEVVKLNPTTAYNPCNNSGKPPFSVPKNGDCNDVFVNGYTLYHLNTADRLRFPLLKPSVYGQIDLTKKAVDRTTKENEYIMYAFVFSIISTFFVLCISFYLFLKTDNGYSLINWM